MTSFARITRSAQVSEKPVTGSHGFIGALADWTTVIHTLMVREVRTKFSGSPVGYLWSFVPPILWIAMIAFVFDFLGRRVPIHTDIISFLISGMLPYLVFRQTITATTRSVRVHRHMMMIAHITAGDILLSSALIELLNSLFVLIMLMAGNALLFSNFEVNDPITALQGFVLAWALGASFGHFVVALEKISSAFALFLPHILRPTFWISGIFFVGNELPGILLSIFSYNPLFHVIEIIRTGLFLSYSSRSADILVPIGWIVGLNAAALFIKFVTTNKAGKAA